MELGGATHGQEEQSLGCGVQLCEQRALWETSGQLLSFRGMAVTEAQADNLLR